MGWGVGWLVSEMVGGLGCWLVSEMVGWGVDWLVSEMVGGLGCWLVSL